MNELSLTTSELINPDKECKYDAGEMIPVVNKTKCEAKDKCTAVCPYNVFELRFASPEDKIGLNFFVKLKIKAHGNKQAYVVNGKDCHACSDCIQACPEHAIKLVKATYQTNL